MSNDYGWFTYGRNPHGRVGEWTVVRSPDDPPVVVWRVNDTMWIVDDDLGDQHVQVSGFNEAEVRASLVFAQAMGWLQPGTEVTFKPLSMAD